MYTFASDDSLVAVFTQKEDRGDEYPISFMSTSLQGAELNYPTVDKQAYAVFKVVKQFRPYMLKVSFCTKGIRRKKRQLGNNFTII